MLTPLVNAASHYGRPSREVMGLFGQTLLKSPKKWAEHSQSNIGIGSLQLGIV